MLDHDTRHPATSDHVVTSLLANVDGLTLHVDPFLDDTGEAQSVEDRHRVVIGDKLAADRDRLYGVVAHEVAHHLLQRFEPRWARAFAAVHGYTFVLLLVSAFLAGRGLLLNALATALLWAVYELGMAWASREEELAADRMAVRLLNGLGLPGADLTVRALSGYPPESRLFRLVGWVFSAHPRTSARLRTARSPI